MKIKYLYLFLPLALSLFLTQCAIPEPFAGLGWSVDLCVPLMSNKYYVKDLADGENFVIENNELKLIFQDELETKDPFDILKISPKTTLLLPIPPLEIGVNIPLNIDETGSSDKDIDITYAVIREGELKFEIKDVSPKLTSLKIIFNDIYQDNGEPFECMIDDFHNPIHRFPLNGYAIGKDDSDSIFDQLCFSVIPIFSDIEAPLGFIRIYFDESLYFDFLKGKLENQQLTLEDEELDFDISYPYNLSNVIQLHQTELKLEFINYFGFDARFTGTLTAFNDTDGKEYTLNITKADNVLISRAGGLGTPSHSTVLIDKPDVAKFLNVFPERIHLYNSNLVIGNNDSSLGFATSSDKGLARFSLSTPAIFKLNNEPVVPDSVLTIEIDEENRDFIDEFSNQAAISLTVENALPFGANISFYFSEESDTLHIFNPELKPDKKSLILIDNRISPAISADNPSTTEINLSLSKDNLRVFNSEIVYFTFKVSFLANEKLVVLKPEQYINVIGKIKLNTDIKF